MATAFLRLVQHRCPSRGIRGLADAGTAVRRGLALARRRWRQSLQLRVVTTTMLLGLVTISILGGVLHEQIADGLESDRVTASASEALALTEQAQTYWDNSTSTSVDELNQAANDIMVRILSDPRSEPNRYVVMSRSAGNESEVVLAELTSGALDLSAVSLTPLEFDLLVALARKPWQVFTREVLLEQVWGYRHAGDTRLVNVHVQRLRSKIEHDPEHPEIVVTVRGVGYKAGKA